MNEEPIPDEAWQDRLHRVLASCLESISRGKAPDRESILALVAAESRTFPVFKPLNDAQYALDQLNLHSRSRGIWMYRNYADVANSCVIRWGDAFVRSYARVATGQTEGGSAVVEQFDVIDPSKRIESIGSYGDPEEGWYLQSDTIPSLALEAISVGYAFWRALADRDEEGKIIRTLAFSIDVTERSSGITCCLAISIHLCSHRDDIRCFA